MRPAPDSLTACSPDINTLWQQADPGLSRGPHQRGEWKKPGLTGGGPQSKLCRSEQTRLNIASKTERLCWKFRVVAAGLA
jgi:hypothetical protein